MNHVQRLWLRRFQLALLLLDVIILGLFIYGRLNGSGAADQHGGVHTHNNTNAPILGISTLIAGLSAFHAVYTACVIWWLDKKQTWLVHAIGLFVSGTVLVLLTNTDSSIHILQHVLVITFVFFATMCGTLVSGLIVAEAFIFLIVSSFTSPHLTSDPGGHVVEMLLVNLSALSLLGGWLVFGKYYLQKSDPKALESLAKIVDKERTTVGLMLESITDGVMIVDPTGVVRTLNASSVRMLGWTKEEAQDLQYASLLQPAANSNQPVEQATNPTEVPIVAKTFSTKTPQHEVGLFKTRDDRQVYIDITVSPILQGDASDLAKQSVVGVIIVLRDVDKQKREEQQRSEFISTASHEMRTPVAAIEGYLALALNNKVSTIDAKARSYIEKAHASTQHLGKLFQDLLTSAKAEDGRLVSHPQVVEMGQYMEQLVESLRFSAEKKGLLLDFTIGAASSEDTTAGKVIKPLYYGYVDPDRMREVITNLFDNAVKYTETGKISIGLTGNNDVVQFFIHDTGPGIPPNDVGHLFQKFYRVDNSATRTIGGTGLGLFICRKIVELYKGRIWVESQLGQGSTFYVNLPRLSSQKAEELLRTQAQASPIA